MMVREGVQTKTTEVSDTRTSRLRQIPRRLADWVRADWRTARVLPGALVLLVIVSAVTVMFYLNHPVPETTHDTPSYTGAALRILANGDLADPNRLPGYPLLIALVFAFAGKGNLVAVSAAQGALFVVATLEVYALTYLITRQVWIAGIVGLLVGTNVWLLAAVKFIMTEGIALWLTVTLALAVGVYIRNPRIWKLWIVALSLLALFMTRAEWMYLPVPLFAYLLFIAWRRGQLRPQIPHALAALVLLYGVLALFVLANANNMAFAASPTFRT